MEKVPLEGGGSNPNFLVDKQLSRFEIRDCSLLSLCLVMQMLWLCLL